MRHLQEHHVRCSQSRVCKCCCVREVTTFTTCNTPATHLWELLTGLVTQTLRGILTTGRRLQSTASGGFSTIQMKPFQSFQIALGLEETVAEFGNTCLQVVKERRRLVMKGCDDHAAERQPSSSGSVWAETWQQHLSHPLSALAGTSPKAHKQPSRDWPLKHLPGGQAQNKPLERQGCG